MAQDLGGEQLFAAGRLIGDYLVHRLIAQGAAGAVLEVEHVHLHRRSALKLLHAQAARSEQMLRRFRREARILASIRHPNVTEIYDFGVAPDGRPYLVMELLDGPSLRQHLCERGRLSPQEALSIAAQVAAGLAEVHARGVVHRDVKLENVLLVPHAGQPTAKLVDFGIARWEEDPARGQIDIPAHTDRPLGSLHAMAPEQIQLDRVDARTDVYALGVLLHELLTGEPPFVGSDSTVRDLHLHGEMRSLTSTGKMVDQLEAVLRRCLEKAADRRYPSAAAFRQALLAIAAPEPAPPAALEPLHNGQIIDERYRIESVRGRGGFAVVYRAQQLALDRSVAIKVLSESSTGEDPAVRRFEQEAKILAALHHPGIARVHDSGTLSDGRLYIAMEWVEGQSLAEWLVDNGPMPLARAVPLMLAICDAVGAAHRAEIIHRDIKPGNILLERDTSAVKLVDFGIARWLRADPAWTTRAGQVIGTPATMAPEQARGEPVDQRSDIYSLGVTFSTLVALDDETTGAIADVLRRCTSLDPVDRHGSVAELARDLRAAHRSAAGRRRWLQAGGVVALASAALLAYLLPMAGSDVAAPLPAPAAAPVPVASELVARGRSLLAQGREEQALAALLRARELGAQEPELPFLLGVALRPLAALRFRLPGEGAPTAMAISRRNDLLAVLRDSGAVELWDLARRRRRLTLPAARSRKLVGLHPDGTLLATGGSDGLALWEVASGRMLRQVETEETFIGGWSEDGERLVTFLRRGPIRIRTARGDLLHQLPGRSDEAMFVPGTAQLLVFEEVAGDSGDAIEHPPKRALAVVELASGAVTRRLPLKFMHVLAGISRSVTHAAFGNGVTVERVDLETGSFTPTIEGSELVLGPGGEAFGLDRQRRLVRWERGRSEPRLAFSETPPLAWQLSPDGSRLAVGHPERAILYDAVSGRERSRLALDSPPARLDFSPDGTLLVTATADGELQLWDAIADLRHAAIDEAAVRAASFVAGDDVATYAASRVRLWSGATGQRLADLPGEGLAVSEDRKWVTTGTAAWDVASGRSARLDVALGFPLGVAINADGTLAATGTIGGELRLWDPRSGRTIAVLNEQGIAYMSLAFSPDGASLAAGRATPGIQVWDFRRARIERELATDTSTRALTFARQGTLLATTTAELLLFDRQRTAPLARAESHAARASWSEDGRQVLVLARQMDTMRAELRDGQTLAALVSYPPATAIEEAGAPPISAGGDSLLVTGTYDGHLVIYALRSGEPLLRLRLGATPIWRVQINREETRLLAVLDDRVVLLDMPRETRKAAEIARWVEEKRAGQSGDGDAVLP